MNVLQTVLLPNASFGCSNEMYINGCNFYPINNVLKIKTGGNVSFDTYYNGLSTVLWKEKCGIKNVAFNMCGAGEALVKLIVVNENNVRFELDSIKTELTNNSVQLFNLNLEKVIQRGLVYIEVIACDSDVEIYSASWTTQEETKRKVKLGISITHFNRKNYVLPSIDRVKKELLDDPEYADKIDFAVVDNSKNIQADEAEGVTIIPNENTGGAGGFMRGLMHYEDKGDFTHVLFMDDDASCEIESIKRAYAILTYAIEDNAAISGALFLESNPDILIEKGAFFDNTCHPLFSGFDLSRTINVVKSEVSLQVPNYGGWWFFAFPINYVKHKAFPFFVRGDDILFGMMNKFNIITCNGIACYSEDFATKVSAMTWYLDTRNHLVNTILYKNSFIPSALMYSRFFMACLFSHQYGSLKSIRLALHHVLGNKEFWSQNYDLKEVRTTIAELSVDEKMKPIDLTSLDIKQRTNEERPIRRVIRILSLNGMLLPLKDQLVYQEKRAFASFRAIFGFKNILYYNSSSQTGYIAQVSRGEFFKNLVLLLKDIVSIAVSFKSNKKKYKSLASELTTNDFWEKILKSKSE